MESNFYKNLAGLDFGAGDQSGDKSQTDQKPVYPPMVDGDYGNYGNNPYSKGNQSLGNQGSLMPGGNIDPFGNQSSGNQGSLMPGGSLDPFGNKSIGNQGSLAPGSNVDAFGFPI